MSPRSKASWLSEARDADQLFVLSLRRWLEGPDSQQVIWNELARTLGPSRARQVLQAFESYLGALADRVTRKLVRHSTPCPCLGNDEALLAGIVRDAGRGDRESALAGAAEIVRDADLVVIVERAAVLGMLLDDISTDAVSGREARARLH